MTWFKIDDTLATHSKPRKAGLAAMGLWVLAGSWSSQQLTDGAVPMWFVTSMPQGKKLAGVLVNAKLWHQPGHVCPKCPPIEEGFLFHEWTERNPTAERVRGDRERKVELRNATLRQAVRERDGDRCRYCGRTVNWMDRRGHLGGTYDHVIPNLAGGIANLVVACRGCNSSKRDRTPAEAGMDLLPEPPPRSGSRSGSRSDIENNSGRFQAGDLSRPDPTHIDTTEVSSNPDSVDTREAAGQAEALLAEHVAACGGKVSAGPLNETGKQIAILLRDGRDADEIRAGLAIWRVDGNMPSSIPHFVDKAARQTHGTQLAVINGGRATNTTDSRVFDALDLAARLAREDTT